MNFFRKLFSKPKKQAYNFREFNQPAIRRNRHPENEQGDFYVVNEECILCGAPEVEGRGLIEHSKKDGYGSCFFKKQPETEEEVEHAINAILVSCIGALRYGGKDENILRKMYELGLSGQCDYVPNGAYRLTICNRVSFYYEGAIANIAKAVAGKFARQSYYKVVDFEYDKTSHFSFSVR